MILNRIKTYIRHVKPCTILTKSNYTTQTPTAKKSTIAIPLALGTISIYFISLHLFYNQSTSKSTETIKSATDIPTPKTIIDLLEQQTDKTRTYDSIANDYDSKTKWDEFVMGLYLLRRYVIKTNASGNVLELSVGTGRNMKYYHDTIGLKNEISSLTLLDKSSSMLQQSESNPYTKSLVKEYIKLGKRIRFYQGDSEHLKEFKENEFDTVIDTFGLCSYKDPIKAIKEMKRVCNKNGGKIILLQHGVGRLEFLNKLLNQHAEDHASKWGCWWNRDILKLCEAAELDVQSVSRFHFGTTYYIVAKP